MFRQNRKEWLKYSRQNLTRFPNRSERYKAFLRESYPKQEGYSAQKLWQVLEKKELQIPLTELIKYGEECNWLTRNGTPFQNIEIFCTVYNGVWLEKQRRAI